MGFLDKIKGLTSKLQPKAQPKAEERPAVTLKIEELDEWTVQMLAASGLDEAFKVFLGKVEEGKERAREHVQKLTDEATLQGVPDRARSVTAVHGNEFKEQVEKLLEKIVFSDVFTFEGDQHAFHMLVDEFRNQTSKNVAALKEFMSDEVEVIEQTLKTLEDDALAFLQEREEKRFDAIGRVQKAQEDLNKHGEQREKYEELHSRLENQLDTVEEKQHKLTEKINDQRKLIRNPAALQALDDLTKLEEELDEITRQHEHAATDALTYYKKHHELDIPPESHGVLQDLPKHPSSFVAEHPSDIMNAFAAIADHLEQEGRGNLGNLVHRLRDRSQTALKDADRAEKILPKQLGLKREIMRDVAAINIYDQQQFLMRAVREKKQLEAKIEFVQEQLGSTGRVELEREIKEAAKAFGAMIVGDTLEDVQPAEEMPTEEEERAKNQPEEHMEEHIIPDKEIDEPTPEEPAEEPEEPVPEEEELEEEEAAEEAHEEEEEEEEKEIAAEDDKLTAMDKEIEAEFEKGEKEIAEEEAETAQEIKEDEATMEAAEEAEAVAADLDKEVKKDDKVR